MRREYNNTQTISNYLRSKGYQTCEYIESHGSEYINTGIDNDGSGIRVVSSELETKLAWLSGAKSFAAAFGVGLGCCALFYPWGGVYAFAMRWVYSDNASNKEIWSYYDTSFHTLKMGNDGRIYVDGTHKATAVLPSSFGVLDSNVFHENNYYMCLFCSNPDDSDTFGKTRIAWFKAKQNGEYVRHFIPIYNISTGAGAFWDAVEDKFYFNQGAGSFTHGPDMEIE